MISPDLQRDFKALFLGDYSRVYISHKHKYIYVSASKSGSTYVLTILHKIEGQVAIQEDPTDPVECQHIEDWVHYRHVFPGFDSPKSIEEFDKLLASNYKIFTVTRHPVSRIFSGWSSKLLDHEGGTFARFIHRYPGWEVHPLPTVDGEMTAYIREEFERFVDFIYTRELPIQNFSDNHWRPQFNSLRPDYIKYNDIVKIENVLPFLKSFIPRYTSEIIDLNYRPNVSLIPYHSDYITDKTYGQLLEIYSQDFDIFQYVREIPRSIRPVPTINTYIFQRAVERADRVHVLYSYISNPKVSLVKPRPERL